MTRRKWFFQGLALVVFGVAMLQVKCSGHSADERWRDRYSGLPYSGSDVNRQDTSSAHAIGVIAILLGGCSFLGLRKAK